MTKLREEFQGDSQWDTVSVTSSLLQIQQSPHQSWMDQTRPDLLHHPGDVDSLPTVMLSGQSFASQPAFCNPPMSCIAVRVFECSTCHRSLPDDEQFCSSCGKRRPDFYEEIGDTATMIPVMKEETPKRRQNKKGSHQGLWTEEEERAFKHGLEMFGRDWDKVVQILVGCLILAQIVEHIGTREKSSVKSHAQQYFIRLYQKGHLLPSKVAPCPCVVTP